ncbi:hypothetical protein BDA99DRAFT_502010 [Phascolomyces articulosus]|uniref:RNI-like protein n=1 Tax=Phascolomyces articulosus TaxID=60185 RepID=A0AAD5PIA3_9FUNG|nr:hypothetical protein BDA99DRAFT_502010 [Phascolomyces articulosus]
MHNNNTWSQVKKFDPLIFTDGVSFDSSLPLVLEDRTQIIIEKLNKAFEFIVHYLDSNTLASCALVNHPFNALCNNRLWRVPRFDNGYLYGSLHLFNRFIDLLPDVRPQQVAHLVTQLNLNEMEESLYENVRPYFFDYLIRYAPNLQILNLSKTNFLSTSSLPSTSASRKGKNQPQQRYPRLSHLRALDLSFCDYISDDLLLALAPALPRLQYLRLDSLGTGAGGGERGLAAFADHCDELASVSVRYNETINDGSIMALAKFGKIRVKEVDLTGCAYITDTGLAAMARFNINLQYLSLAKTACTASTAEMFLVGRSARYLRHLDLGYCMDLDPHRVARSLWSNTTLTRLAVSMSVAQAMLDVADGRLCPTPIEFFVVHDVSSETPIQILRDLVAILPYLKHITFTQDYDEMDNYMSFYTESNTPKIRMKPSSVISKQSIREFNLAQHRVIATITNDRETIEGLTLHYW